MTQSVGISMPYLRFELPTFSTSEAEVAPELISPKGSGSYLCLEVYLERCSYDRIAAFLVDSGLIIVVVFHTNHQAEHRS